MTVLLYSTGEYKVAVCYHGKHIQGSPFIVKAWDAQMVVVSNISPGRVGQPGYFNSESLLIMV